ncbi:MAG: heme-degrading domain-containing protein [Roseibium sp.]|uniref:heme-degrading domain-containing protein n=1 Tax=Roseibium sp. TaxID=1936156 RepID=UPI001B077352|nr:heme-degrading domain-containing protein [Roseibium sp.]MBO6893907.1 heme-degrading domain-containing protein [Roseibium sp.]MBO6931388.1 heme-degrading domain-containing protein [Roseibium sp.]
MSLKGLSDKELVEQTLEQEQRLVFNEFGLDLAHQVGLELLNRGKDGTLPIAFDVTRNGQCVFHCALHGATQDNAAWIQRKNNVVNRFGHSSLHMGAACRLSGMSIEEKFHLPPNQFADHGGGFPIHVRGAGIIGTVTVSGLPQIDDHELVVSVLEMFLD